MIVLDTNVLSELMRLKPDRRVVEWLDNQDPLTLAISAITVAEILYGIECLPAGRRKRALAGIAAAMFAEDFAGRILPFDSDTAIRYAGQVVACEQAGRGVQMADAQNRGDLRPSSSEAGDTQCERFRTIGNRDRQPVGSDGTVYLMAS